MTPERWRQIEQIYHDASELGTGERAAFLNQACAGDKESRRKVESLLKARERASDFLEAPALEVAARAAAANPEGSLSGSLISHYRIVSFLGAGGMGEVYLAQDTRLDRRVALKILPAGVASDPARTQRFTREAKAASAFNHPNVAAIYDVGEAEGIRFIAMEYVEGNTLAERIADGRLDPSAIVEFGIQAADALSEAHSKGITHRDIKPANMMVTSEGRVKILDFGLAKVSQAEGGPVSEAMEGRTLSGFVMGSAPYMSPEQALGREIDARSDIFSLGATLYEAATGRLPFEATSTAGVVDQILHAQPGPVSSFNPTIPAELDRIVRKCLEKDRERRYQSARELFVDFKNLQRDSGSIPADPPGSRPFSRRGLSLTVLGLALILLAVLGAMYYRKVPVVEPIRSVVVLPFVNDSNDPDTEALSDGITNTIINSLTQVRTLDVIAPTTSHTFKGKSMDPRQIGRELNVRAVVTGQMIRRGDSLNIQVNLMDVSTGFNLWGTAAHYPGRLADIFTVQDAIAAKIVEGLRLRLSSEEQRRMTKHPTEDPEAYELYTRGRYYALKSTREGFEKALALYDLALEHDKNYALAYAGKAEALMYAADLTLPATEAGPRAKTFALKAIQLDNQLSEAHCALASVQSQYDWDWDGALANFKQAQELDPASGCVNDIYGIILASIGRQDDALTELKKALRLDQKSAVRHMNLGIALYYSHQPERAIREFLNAIEVEPDYWFVHLWLGNAKAQLHKYEEALAEFQQLPDDEFPDKPLSVALGLALAGRTEEAEKMLEGLIGSKPRKTAWAIASVYTALGKKDLAIQWFEKARDEHFVVIESLKVDPLFDSLRHEPGYTRLLRSINLEP